MLLLLLLLLVLLLKLLRQLLQRLVMVVQTLERAEVWRKRKSSESALQGRGHGCRMAVQVLGSVVVGAGQDVGDHEAGGSDDGRSL